MANQLINYQSDISAVADPAAGQPNRPRGLLVWIVGIGGLALSVLLYWILAVHEYRLAESNDRFLPVCVLLAGVLLTGLAVGCLVLLRKQAVRVEQLVAQRTAELYTISNSALDAVVMMDHDGNVVHWNPAAERIFGYGRNEILGRHVHDTLVPEKYREAAGQGIKKFAESGLGIVVGNVLELEAVRKDGSQFPIEISVSPIRRDGRWWAVAIIRDITKRRLVEERVLKEQQLLRELLDLQERERKLLAYEIHDGLAQQLTGALFQLQTIHDQEPEQAKKTLENVMRLLRDGIGETRRLIGGLRPPILDESGIIAAVDYLIAQQQQHDALEIEFTHEVRSQRFAPPLESAVFRIVQESLANAARHSRSKKVRVELIQLEDCIRLEIRDWGIGFNVAEVVQGRFGLQGIRERARLLGGKATVDSAPGKGTHIVVELPLVEINHDGY